MNEEMNVPAQEEATPQVEQSTVKDIIRNLIADGATRVNKLRIKNVNFDEDHEKKDYCRVSLTLDRAVEGYVSKDNGATFERGMTNIIWTSTFALGATLKESEDNAWLANPIVQRPQALNLILSGATIDIIQREYSKGSSIVNPFSTNTEKVWPIAAHDTIISDVIDIKLSKTGEKMAMRMADAILFG